MSDAAPIAAIRAFTDLEISIAGRGLFHGQMSVEHLPWDGVRVGLDAGGRPVLAEVYAGGMRERLLTFEEGQLAEIRTRRGPRWRFRRQGGRVVALQVGPHTLGLTWLEERLCRLDHPLDARDLLDADPDWLPPAEHLTALTELGLAPRAGTYRLESHAMPLSFTPARPGEEERVFDRRDDGLLVRSNGRVPRWYEDNWVARDHDAHGRCVKVCCASGHWQRFAHDDSGQRVACEDLDGERRWSFVDGVPRLEPEAVPPPLQWSTADPGARRDHLLSRSRGCRLCGRFFWALPERALRHAELRGDELIIYMFPDGVDQVFGTNFAACHGAVRGSCPACGTPLTFSSHPRTGDDTAHVGLGPVNAAPPPRPPLDAPFEPWVLVDGDLEEARRVSRERTAARVRWLLRGMAWLDWKRIESDGFGALVPQDPEIQLRRLVALGELARPPLLSALGSAAGAGLRAWAATGLGRLRPDPDTLAALCTATERGPTAVAKAAGLSLCKLAPERAVGVARQRHAAGDVVSLEMALTLARGGRVEVFPILAEWVGRISSSWDCNAVFATLRELDAERTTAVAVVHLNHGDAVVRCAAARALARGGATAFEPLLGALADPDAGVRQIAIRSLGALGDPRAVPWLARMLADTAPHAASAVPDALATLARAGDSATFAAALELLAKAARHPAAHVRERAVFMLRHLELPLPLPDPVLEIVRRALRDDDPRVVQHAGELLTQHPDGRLEPDLRQALRADSGRYALRSALRSITGSGQKRP